jgi:serine/threonine protein kinase
LKRKNCIFVFNYVKLVVTIFYYIAEYGLGGNPSIKGDVYSFGVLILELITGKRPTNIIFHEGLTLHDWVKSHYPHDIDAIVSGAHLQDPICYNKLKRDILVELVELGLVCTQISPAMRPTMVDAAHEITILKEDLEKQGGFEASDQSGSMLDSSF